MAHRTVLVPLEQPSPSEHERLQQTFDRYQHCRTRTCDYCWDDPTQPDDLLTSKNTAEAALYDPLREATDFLHSNLVQKAIKDVTDAMTTLETHWKQGERISKPDWTDTNGWTMTYDKRAATFSKHSVSLATVDGRITLDYRLPADLADTPYTQYVLAPEWDFAESELMYRDGQYWLHLGLKRAFPDDHWTARIDDEVSDAPQEDATRVLGVDLNVTGYTAVTSAGGFHGNADHLTHRRAQYEQLRAELQQTGTRSAHQRLQARRGVEAAWFEEYAHCVANGIVEDALEVSATHVVFENLVDIRDRISNEPDYQQWMFDRIQSYVEYKLEPFGVEVKDVRPQNTSKQCSHTDCRHTSDANRSGKQFVCERCGRSWNADYNAARNIGMRYLTEELPASQTRSTGKATRQLALMSGTLSPAGTFTPHDWVSTDKPTASAVGR